MATFITNADVYRVCGLTASGPVSSTDVDALILSAQLEAARYLGVGFTSATATDIAVTDEYYDGDGTNKLHLRNRDINSISSLAISNDQGSTWTSISSGKYWFYASGVVILKNTAEQTFFTQNYQSVKISYKYGVVPTDDHKWLMAAICGIKVLVNQQGGTYSHVQQFSLPEMSGAIGDENAKIRATIDSLKNQVESFLKLYPKKLVSLV